MNQWKKIILFSVVLVILIGALIGTSLYKNNQAASSDAASTPAYDPLIDLAEADIAKITVENDKGTLVFSSGTGKTESGDEIIDWSLTSPKNDFYNPDTIKRKIDYYISIEAEGVITNSNPDLSEYGLDDPTTTILFTLKSGEKIRVLFGNEAAGSTTTHYAMLEDGGRICVINTVTVRAANLAPVDFLDSSLVLNEFTAAEAMEVDFKRGDDVAFIAISNNDASETEGTAATWKVTSPINGDADSGFNTLLDQLVAIKAESFIEIAPADMAKYGFDKPSYEFTITGDKKSAHCILGASAGNSQLYAYSEHMDAVFIVSTGDLSSIDMPFLDLMSKFVHLQYIWDLTDIDIEIDGQTIHCDVSDNKDDSTDYDFKVNGEDANVLNGSDTPYFRSFYQSLLSVFIKGLDLAATPEYEPVILVKYTTKVAADTTIVGFVERDDSTYYAFKNGEYQGYYVDINDSFYSEKVGSEGIVPAYEILQNAMENQVDGVYE